MVARRAWSSTAEWTSVVGDGDGDGGDGDGTTPSRRLASRLSISKLGVVADRLSTGGGDCRPRDLFAERLKDRWTEGGGDGTWAKKKGAHCGNTELCPMALFIFPFEHCHMLRAHLRGAQRGVAEVRGLRAACRGRGRCGVPRGTEEQEVWHVVQVHGKMQIGAKWPHLLRKRRALLEWAADKQRGLLDSGES